MLKYWCMIPPEDQEIFCDEIWVQGHVILRKNNFSSNPNRIFLENNIYSAGSSTPT